jgi:hypothetical protein
MALPWSILRELEGSCQKTSSFVRAIDLHAHDSNVETGSERLGDQPLPFVGSTDCIVLHLVVGVVA